jgi:hypothetical protein
MCISIMGCANISTIKVSKEKIENESLILIPTGKFNVVARADSNPVAGTGIVGALFAVADAIQAASHVKRMTEIIPGAVPPDELLNFTSSVIKEKIYIVGKPKSIMLGAHSRIADEFTDWFNPENRSDIKLPDDKSAAYAIDYGFHGLGVVRYGSGMFVEGWLGLRLIDLKTGAVVARSRAWGVGSIGGELVRAEIGDPNLEKSVQSAIKSFVERLGREALAKIASS